MEYNDAAVGSLNCWMAEWEKESKMLAFLGMVKLVGLTAGS